MKNMMNIVVVITAVTFSGWAQAQSHGGGTRQPTRVYPVQPKAPVKPSCEGPSATPGKRVGEWQTVDSANISYKRNIIGRGISRFTTAQSAMTDAESRCSAALEKYQTPGSIVLAYRVTAVEEKFGPTVSNWYADCDIQILKP